MVAFNSVPKIAFAPIIILWFGTGLTSKVALSISLTAIVALIAAYQAAKDADPRPAGTDGDAGREQAPDLRVA